MRKILSLLLFCSIVSANDFILNYSESSSKTNKNLSAKGSFDYNISSIQNNFSAERTFQSQNSVASSDILTLKNVSKYFFDDNYGSYLKLKRVKDKTDNIADQEMEIFGILYSNEYKDLKIETKIGLGLQQEKLDSSEKVNENILNYGFDLTYRLNEMTKLEAKYDFYNGTNTDGYEIDYSLDNKINKNFFIIMQYKKTKDSIANYPDSSYSSFKTGIGYNF